jgi:hypothetical protein
VCLLANHKALSSNPSTAKKEKKKKERNRCSKASLTVGVLFVVVLIIVF